MRRQGGVHHSGATVLASGRCPWRTWRMSVDEFPQPQRRGLLALAGRSLPGLCVQHRADLQNPVTSVYTPPIARPWRGLPLEGTLSPATGSRSVRGRGRNSATGRSSTPEQSSSGVGPAARLARLTLESLAGRKRACGPPGLAADHLGGAQRASSARLAWFVTSGMTDRAGTTSQPTRLS